MKAQAIIVNENNIIIGYKDRSEITSDDIQRVSAARITDSQGNILLAQRSWNKRNSPGKRGPAAAGTLEKGETYESNIIKEIKEELGIDFTIEELSKQPVEYIDSGNKRFIQWFVGTYQGNKNRIIKQDDEVEAVQWFSHKELEKLTKESPEKFVKGLAAKLEQFKLY